MITKITDSSKLTELLSGTPDIYTEKVRSLFDAYGIDYQFCSFYTQTGGAVISDYYRSACVANCGTRPGDRLAELMEFLTCGMFRKVIMPYYVFEAANIDANVAKLALMKCRSDIDTADDIDKVVTETEFSISEIYEIASDGFDIDFNKWYTDTSHMIRHGISKLYALDKKACAVKMFSYSGITYLSYICTKESERGKGLATRLVKSICAAEARRNCTVYVFCEDPLVKFYENAGFMKIDEAAEITI